jgi:hypothetical protein
MMSRRLAVAVDPLKVHVGGGCQTQFFQHKNILYIYIPGYEITNANYKFKEA